MNSHPTFGALPGKEVAKGESWSKNSELNLGPIGSYVNVFKYTLEGKEGVVWLFGLAVVRDDAGAGAVDGTADWDTGRVVASSESVPPTARSRSLRAIQ